MFASNQGSVFSLQAQILTNQNAEATKRKKKKLFKDNKTALLVLGH